jgi:hypothetical protein
MTIESKSRPSLEEQACNWETMKHIHLVGKNIHTVVRELLTRAENHDASKLEAPEVEYFTEYTSKLSAVTYGSAEYNRMKAEMQPALDHHYANNRHHPESHKRGIDDMNLIDIVEMLCDWQASSKRHNDGNVRKSIEINGKRFDMSPQLVRIFENTVQLFE